MKVKVLRTFKDLKGKAIRKKDEVFDVDKKRFQEINSTSHGKLVEIVEEEANKNEQNN